MRTTTRNALTSAGMVGLAVLGLACSKITGSSGSSGGTTPDPQASAATTTTTTTTTTAAAAPSVKPPSAAAAARSPIDARTAPYPLADIKPLAAGCATPAVILANAPASVGDSYGWPISRQAFLANQQLKIVSQQPAAPGEVRLSSYHYNPFGTAVYALVATCSDGGTCNQVAAMYKAVVRSSKPQLVCGSPSGIAGITGDALSFSWGADPKDNLPTTADREGQCARLSACALTYRSDTPGDPFLDCQSGKAHFDLGCASRYPCSDVLACAPNVSGSAATAGAAGAGGGGDAECAKSGAGASCGPGMVCIANDPDHWGPNHDHLFSCVKSSP
jgi:hypothetical protein